MIQCYDPILKRLKNTQRAKIKKLIENKCIRYVGNNTYICLPIKGYNKTTYIIRRSDIYECGFECNCQGFQTKVKKGEYPICSHIGAVYEYIKGNGGF